MTERTHLEDSRFRSVFYKVLLEATSRPYIERTIYIHITNEGERIKDFLPHSPKTMNNRKDQNLAYEIAKTLDDLDSLQYHLTTVKKYKEEFLRKILQKVMTTPEEKIKRSRAALYTFLVNQHGSQTRNDFRD